MCDTCMPAHMGRRVGKFAEAAIKATNELETVITIISANQRQMRRHDPLRKYMDIVCDFAGACTMEISWEVSG